LRHNGGVSILYPIAADAEMALAAPAGRAARERQAETLSGGPVAFVREFVGPVFKNEDEARAAHAGRIDGLFANLAPEDRFCELKPIAQRSLMPFAGPHTAWRLSVGYWRTGGVAAPAGEAGPPVPQARKARRQRKDETPDVQALEAIAREPLRPIRPQQPLDIGLFETRLPEAPHIVVADE
jgi:hypothetical protein